MCVCVCVCVIYVSNLNTHKNGVGHLFPDLRLVESTSPYPTMN